jgi:hypothetical protein
MSGAGRSGNSHRGAQPPEPMHNLEAALDLVSRSISPANFMRPLHRGLFLDFEYSEEY